MDLMYILKRCGGQEGLDNNLKIKGNEKIKYI